ncbi:agglutinin-2 [Quercus suber]|uniref:Agglutinin-2 n=1 Tax=Quercus suber TaxID=58331 RepID=A0AAW0LKI2_QUESU
MDSQSLYSLPFLCVLFFCCFPYTTSMISFFFPDFSPNDNNIIVSGTATKAQVDEHPSIRLTDNVDNVGDNQYFSIGRAYYYKPIPLWDPVANVITNFTTTFEFVIRTRNGESLWSHSGGGIAFFITSEDSVDAPTESIGGWMGLFNSTTDGKSSSKMVAVEFDTWNDTIWEDDPSNNHVGIDVNSIVSEVSRPYDLTQRDGDDILMATVSYDGTSEILSVFLKHLDHPYLPLNLTHNVKLRDVLPEKVMMGFSAATGGGVPVQAIRSWSFSSTLDLGSTQNGGKGTLKMWLVGLITGLVLFVSGEWEQCVVHRDIKSSNVMLDSNFNAKLGDFEAVDETLNGDYDMDEMKCLMTIGLWCAHPDHTLRPSIRQAIKVLNYEAPLPSLLSKMPMPLYNYYAPGTMTADQIQFFCTSKESSTSATKDDSRV